MKCYVERDIEGKFGRIEQGVAEVETCPYCNSSLDEDGDGQVYCTGDSGKLCEVAWVYGALPLRTRNASVFKTPDGYLCLDCIEGRIDHVTWSLQNEEECQFDYSDRLCEGCQDVIKNALIEQEGE